MRSLPAGFGRPRVIRRSGIAVISIHPKLAADRRRPNRDPSGCGSIRRRPHPNELDWRMVLDNMPQTFILLPLTHARLGQEPRRSRLQSAAFVVSAPDTLRLPPFVETHKPIARAERGARAHDEGDPNLKWICCRRVGERRWERLALLGTACASEPEPGTDLLLTGVAGVRFRYLFDVQYGTLFSPPFHSCVQPVVRFRPPSR